MKYIAIPMFQLRLAPRFREQRKALLALHEPPDIPLPEPIEEAIAHLEEGTPSPSRVRPMELWYEILATIRPTLWVAVLQAFAVSLATAGSTLVAMKLMKDAPILGYAPLTGWVLASLFLHLASQWGAYLNGLSRTTIRLAAENRLIARVSRKIIALSAAASSRQSSGNLKTLIASDAQAVSEFLDNFVRNLVPGVCAIIVTGPFIVSLAGVPGMVSIVVMTGIIPIAFGLNAIGSRLQDKSQAELDLLTSTLAEWLKHQRLVRYLSWSEAFQETIAKKAKSFLSYVTLQHLIACLVFGFSVSWWMVASLSIVLTEAFFPTGLEVESFFATTWLITFMAGYFMHLPNTVRLYGKASPSIKRLALFLSEEEQQEFLGKSEPFTSATGSPKTIVLESVSFTYPDGTRALEEFSATIHFDRKLALIGEIGSGKTTLLKLLSGELPPTTGKIWLTYPDGKRLDLWTPSGRTRLRGLLAYIPQDPFISSDLLSTNISLEVGSDESETLESAYWAELSADLERLPQGIQQEIGEGGVNLSGGQKQRLNLARAHFFKRPYWLLDDPLSAVDRKTEKAIADRLKAFRGGFTWATHRIDELAIADEIWVLESGRIVDRRGRIHE